VRKVAWSARLRFHPLEPHHGVLVLTLNLRTPEMEVQPVTGIRQRLFGNGAIQPVMSFAYHLPMWGLGITFGPVDRVLEGVGDPSGVAFESFISNAAHSRCLILNSSHGRWRQCRNSPQSGDLGLRLGDRPHEFTVFDRQLVLVWRQHIYDSIEKSSI
jgi:hypothetical protein